MTGTCPHCGYCPNCGRVGTIYISPYWVPPAIYTAPTIYTVPIYPYTVASDTNGTNVPGTSTPTVTVYRC